MVQYCYWLLFVQSCVLVVENSLSRSHLDISNSYEALDDLLDKQQLLQESLSQERTEFSR